MKLYTYLICLFLCALTSCSKRITLEDVGSKDDLAAYHDTTEAQADYKTGADMVKRFEAELPSKSCEELIGLLQFGMSAEGPYYYLYRDGNAAVKEELRARGESARATLLRYINDSRMIFTGANGQLMPLGFMCQALIGELDRKKEANQQPEPTRMDDCPAI